MPRIDLKELAARESEQVEWKENVADVGDVVKTLAAFANDYSNLGGGYVVCGAAESRDEHGFPKMLTPGLTAARLREIEGRVMTACRERVDPPIVPVVEELAADTPDRKVLVFIAPATGHAHSVRVDANHASTYYIRISRETREARNGLFRELLVRKGALEPWDRRIHPTATTGDIDTIALREYLQQMSLWDPGKSLDEYLSPDTHLAALAAPLCGREPLTGIVRPRNFALLLFGRQPTRFFPGAFAVFSVYPGEDRGQASAERIQLDGNTVEQAHRLIANLNTQAYAIFDKTGDTPNLRKYPKRALHEAVINALVHRDYESDQPVRVTVFASRIEIYSPGPLPSAVDRETFVSGRATPVWRNQSLAYFFNKLQLAQAEGQGIPTIIRAMSEEGCPPPRFDIGPESLTCVLPAHPRHRLHREYQAIENAIVLGKLDEAARRTETLLQDDPYNHRAIELFCETHKLVNAPEQVHEFLRQKQVDPARLNVATQLLLAEVLAAIPEADSEVHELVRKLLAAAINSHLQETEVRRLVVSLRKVGDDEQAIAIIDRALGATPSLESNAGLLELRAKARLELAKRCTTTAKNRDSSPRIRARAWEQCRAYLDEAERDLHTAHEHAKSAVERQYIDEDLKFLRYMQKVARKPVQKGGRRPKKKR